MKNPPSGVKLVMAAVCVMKDIKPEKINDPAGTGKKVNKLIQQCKLTITYSVTLLTTYWHLYLQVEDYWGPSKKLLGDMNFLRDLKEYDKDNIPVSIFYRLR